MYLVPLVLLFLLLFFPRRKVYFILHVGGVRDSSSAGQSLTYVSILEAQIRFEGGCEGLPVSKNHYLLLYLSLFLLIICNFYMFSMFVLVFVSLFVWLFVHKCMVLQLSVCYGI